jgi:hypothetical protein
LPTRADISLITGAKGFGEAMIWRGVGSRLAIDAPAFTFSADSASNPRGVFRLSPVGVVEDV